MKIRSFLAVIFLLAAAFAFAGSAHAQTFGTMPVLYNASSQPVNTSGGTLPAGTYYLQTGGVEPVTYFAGGTFYDPATRMTGGSFFNPTGAAGVYAIPDNTGTTLGIPNTGAGGNAAAVWALLLVSGLVAVLGGTYLARSRYVFSS